MRTACGRVSLGLLLFACGGVGDDTKPIQALPAPTAAPAEPSAEKSPAAKPSMRDMQRSVVETLANALNAHDATKAASIFTDEAVLQSAGMADEEGKDAIQKHISTWLTAFPNAKFAVARAWGKNDVVVYEWVTKGTHSAEYMGIKATEKPVGLSGLSIAWVTPDGKVKEEHDYSDVPTLLAQMGVGPKGVKARPIPAMTASIEWYWAKNTPEEDEAVDVATQKDAALEKKDEAAFLAKLADNVAWDDLTLPAKASGKDEAKKLFKTFTTAFPDLKVKVDNGWGVLDFAILETTITGTHRGPFLSIPATKKSISAHNAEVVQIKDGKIVKGIAYGNGAEVMGQLGVKPPSKK